MKYLEMKSITANPSQRVLAAAKALHADANPPLGIIGEPDYEEFPWSQCERKGHWILLAHNALEATDKVATSGLEAALATVPPGHGITITIEPDGASRVVIRSPDYECYSWEAGDQETYEETGWKVCASAADPVSAVLDAVNLASVKGVLTW